MTLSTAHISKARIPLAVPFVTALRRVDYVEHILLRLETDSGLVAFGSAPATEAITGETLQSIEQILKSEILPALLGQPFDLEQMKRLVADSVAGNSSAKACAEMALYFLAARQTNQPLYRLLGGKEAKTFSTAVTVGLNTPDAMVAQANSYCKRGFDILKIKVGSSDGLDATRIRTLATALPTATLLVDANQAWSADESLRILEQCHDLPLALIEQPVVANDLAGLKRVAATSPFPILADEAVFTACDAEHVLAENAADLINIKLMKCGGLGCALDILDVCRRYGKRCMLGSMLEGPVSITAALHLAAAYPDMFEYLDLDSPLLYATLPPDLPFTVQGNTYAL
jgi:o-succinylbenzoate synthase